MANNVNRNKNSLFKKRHFINVMKWTVNFLSYQFAYKRPPYLFESANDDNVLMSLYFGTHKKRCAIFYDYLQWKKCYDDYTFDEKVASVMFITAHEMRHYYQFRQINSKHPNEPKERLELWQKNKDNILHIGRDCSEIEYFMQPLEIDANLFAYVFVADMTDLLTDIRNATENYAEELEKYYIELWGETNEELFPKDSTSSCILD